MTIQGISLQRRVCGFGNSGEVYSRIVAAGAEVSL